MSTATFCLDCRTITPTGPRCPACARKRNQTRDEASPYKTRRWRQVSTAVRRQAGHCTVCGSTRRLTVHHLQGRDDADIGRGPFEVLCASCHSSYEADKRNGHVTDLTRVIDSLAADAPPSGSLRTTETGSRRSRS